MKYQRTLTDNIACEYDFVVCGAGSAGSVVARRLTDNSDVTVLLIEAGGTDDLPACANPNEWPTNLKSDRVWQFETEPQSSLHSRNLTYPMGKVLGGGSSINACVWAIGHKGDWDSFAETSGTPAWNYDSVRSIYRKVEDWQGQDEREYRGSGGSVYIAPNSSTPLAPAFFEAAATAGLPRLPHKMDA